jgi:tetratricopeptide (TPR) repeat protein
MRSRWFSWLCLAAVLLALGLGALATLAERRFQAGLSKAKADVGARRFEAAGRWLAAQSASRPDHAEAALLLGICEHEAGRHEAALTAWARVPPESPLAPSAAIARGRTLFHDLGRFADAEAVLAVAVDYADPHAVQRRYLLTELFYLEGRLDEMRRLVQERWNASPNGADDLRRLWQMGNAVAMVDQIQATVEQAARQAPADDRVWLARANLALLRGQFADAARWLDACLKRRPDDSVVWRARLRWARAADSIDEARRALAHLPADRFSPTEVLSLRAWFAARAGRVETEQTALEQVIDQAPGDTQALERLAALATELGQSDRAIELRRRKAGIDRAKDRYTRLLDSGETITQFSELAGLAEKSGRGFEARGWWFLASRHQPSALITSAIDRLGPPRPDPHLPAGKTLVFHLGDVAGLMVDEPSPSRGGSPPALLPSRNSSDAAQAMSAPEFRDDAASAGLRFVFDNGQSSLRQVPETMAGGVGVLDYDGDGWFDLYVVQGGAFPPDPSRPSTGDRLFRNRGDGTFEDVAERSGIARMNRGYSHGIAVGDFDNDGRPDLFVTRWRSYALYRNRGDGTFEDITERAGLGGDRDWPTSAAFADLDNDGDLDLYVCHYLAWDAERPKLCKHPTKPGQPVDPNHVYAYCLPNPLSARPDHLFRNDGGRFVDVTAEAGIVDPNGRGLGVVAADLDGDGLIDLFVANDTTANYFWHNVGGMKFEESALVSGVACNAQGAFQAGMGTAVGDLDGDGLPDLTVTNDYGESTSFFRNMGNGIFTDQTSKIGLAAPSRYLVGFGIVLFDANNDGRLDLGQTNGHVDDYRPDFPLDMPSLLLIGADHGRLVDVTPKAGPTWSVPRIGRALAAGDLDNDGRIDLVSVPQNTPLVFFHNRTASAAGHAVTFLLEGTKSNRDGVGAVVTVTAGSRRRRAWRFGGGSYQSACDPRLHFGLGMDRIEEVEVRWPSGHVDRFKNVEPDRCYRLREADKTLRSSRFGGLDSAGTAVPDRSLSSQGTKGTAAVYRPHAARPKLEHSASG